jgi:predicted porin
MKNVMPTHRKNDRSIPAKARPGIGKTVPFSGPYRRVGYRPLGWNRSMPFSGLGAAAVLMMATMRGSAQQALQDLMANDAATESRNQQMQLTDYTYKAGDFRILAEPSVDLQWNDNINLAQTGAESDFIVEPSVHLTTSYPLTQENVFFLDFTIGYNKYISHSELDTLDLNSQSGSGFSFDLDVKDVKVNFHDRFSYSQDSSQNAQVSNTGSYGTFQNAAGVSADWDLNDVTLSAGYDHQTVLATSSQFSQDNQNSELLTSRLGLRVHPQVTTGVEATAAFTKYDQNQLNDNNSYSFGVFADIRPDEALTISPRVGYTLYDFQQTSTNIQTSSLNSWYADLVIKHDITKTISYTIDAGHEVQLGVQADVTEDWYARPTITWNVIKGWQFQTGFFYDHGTEGQGSTYGLLKLNDSQTYDWYGGNFTVSHPLTKRFDLALNYRITTRSVDSTTTFVGIGSGTTSGGYLQNMVELTLTYHPPRIP